jgi:hypothetical protein
VDFKVESGPLSQRASTVNIGNIADLLLQVLELCFAAVRDSGGEGEDAHLVGRALVDHNVSPFVVFASD